MQVKSARFIRGIIGTHPILEEGLPTFAFAGRSNVGKSSVINSLLGQKELVRSSSRPGQTRQINYFLINEQWYCADLPGYGYARLSLDDREKLRKLLLWYLTADEVKLSAVVLVIDAKVGLKDTDYELLETMRSMGRRVVLVANKIDKLKQSEAAQQIKKLREEAPDCTILPYSALKKTGRKALQKAIFSVE